MFIKAIKIAAIFSCIANPVFADQLNSNRNYGFSLPNAPMPNGFDEVRAADGTTCRSSMSGNGAYLDVGGIGGQSDGSSNFDSGTVYGRLVIPLGQKPGRVDCRSLYQLEIERLKNELRLAKSGLGAGGAQGGSGNWQKEGWNNN
jgi:hypothetical protein